MSLASKIGTIIGTTIAYAAHYMIKGATPLSVVTLLYLFISWWSGTKTP